MLQVSKIIDDLECAIFVLDYAEEEASCFCYIMWFNSLDLVILCLYSF
jgi:hypothetical protein